MSEEMTNDKPAEKPTESLPRRQTDPLWLHDYLLGTGVDADTPSATGTFIKRKDRIYVCTCRHVIEALSNPQKMGAATAPTISLRVGPGFLNLSHLTASGVNLTFRSPQDPSIDIAITPLSNSYWGLLTERKNKAAIDLDNWREPNWPDVKWGIAAGYPDEHKTRRTSGDIEQIANQLINAIAEVASTLPPKNGIITLSSRLDNSHSWYFSGLSGGPLYLVDGQELGEVEDGDLLPAGIVFQGFPSSARPDVPGRERDPSEAFLDDKDLFIRALELNPNRFDEWLSSAAF